MVKIAVLVSGGGTNLQALLDSEERGENPLGKITLVVSSSPTAYALERANNHGVKSAVLRRKDHPGQEAYDRALHLLLEENEIDLIVLAGFMCILGAEFTRGYAGRILNIHPSLIPAFCGEGYYGLHVHEAALQYGVKVTGATVHLVSEVVDGGKILLQKAVAVHEGDTPETLQRRVMEEAEWELLPKAVAMLCSQIQNKEEQR